ncbi:MAG: carboxylating nicotinate-nucleotide diphosphorylase [Microcystis wesenbergii TW10]|uniref:nicotinate-nucleotide diphosphorylase (carboxylating) n=4 Tax=Microcystis TaxID=1125 RepID=A0ABU3HGB6_9CHRO|nr:MULTISPECIES: carboxylating nicotinate-nucleotide diphosphorylase [Microcystis]REJ52813.1 MAG: carboxylating nicotinate-nucleotide diphosphorylase [Microcystis wesenbergii TW10]TRT85565.1 MAG: carboxylating nicotinate-nucleotide diphosphorylase [Microcystis aeruginosa Ma_OC_H_19870700_S124]MBD2118699.1 carboxylating nicotinate-nucleotide diphosphorylase [Microcystis wesenbergii FACHB-1339]MCZ8038759.1 carboxylating nicotinate-nucleotide diphosphorylase [Microcystis sp. LE17-20A]MCZ8213759.1
MLPPLLVLDPLLENWLREDLGRGDRTTQAIFFGHAKIGQATWIAKEAGVIAGLPVAERVFQLLNPTIHFTPTVAEGEFCPKSKVIAEIEGSLDALLIGERVALNLAMRLSGIASATRKYVEKIADLSTRLVDTRKTTPGLRILEKYASGIGGAINHRLGLDDAIMIKDNHIQAAGSIEEAVRRVRQNMPYPLTIEVETSQLEEVNQALQQQVEIIMLDNMDLEMMQTAVEMIRNFNSKTKIEASGNITLDRIRNVAETGVDYISTSAPITRSTWLDISMRID